MNIIKLRAEIRSEKVKNFSCNPLEEVYNRSIKGQRKSKSEKREWCRKKEMDGMKMSDMIADFIGEMLSDGGGVAELQRRQVADRFSCVPSQVNYVIGGGNGFQRGAVRLPEVGVLRDGGIPCVEPLGRGKMCIRDSARLLNLPVRAVADLSVVPGRGIAGTVDGVPYAVGNSGFRQDKGISWKEDESRLREFMDV